MYHKESEAAIDVLKSYLDFSGKVSEYDELEATISFLEEISTLVSYEEILEMLK